MQGRHSEAIALAVSATEVLANSSNTRVLARGNAVLGNVLLESGDARSALALLRQADAVYAQSELGLSTRRAEVPVALGRAQLQLGEVSAAVTSLASANAAWNANDAKNRARWRGETLPRRSALGAG